MQKRARFASHSRHLASNPCNTRKLKITHRGQAGNKIQALREGTCAPSVEQPTQVHNKMKSNRWLDRRDKLTQKGCCSSWDHGLGTPKQSGPARAHGPSHQQGRDINLVYIHPRLRRARSLRGVRRVPAATAALPGHAVSPQRMRGASRCYMGCRMPSGAGAGAGWCIGTKLQAAAKFLCARVRPALVNAACQCHMRRSP